MTLSRSRTESARAALRSATAGHHQRLDTLFSAFDLADREAYKGFLMVQSEAHLSVETALTRAGAAAVLPDWPSRQRAALLLADLAALDLPAPTLVETGAFDGPAAVLGGVYVLEGSRLGGRVLQRSLPPHSPSRFLSAGDPSAWQRLLGLLEERLCDEHDRMIAIEAATSVFSIFEASGTRFLDRPRAAPRVSESGLANRR